MLPKKNRADKQALHKVFREGKFLNSPALAFKYIFTAAPAPQISFIAPKNVARLAVNRNALRRLGYKALEKNKSSLPPGLVGTFIFKNYQDNVAALENEIKSILSKIN